MTIRFMPTANAARSTASPRRMANACKKPGQWQTYDIIFEAARWDANHKLARPAIVTVIQNGVLIHYKQPILGPIGPPDAGHVRQRIARHRADCAAGSRRAGAFPQHLDSQDNR